MASSPFLLRIEHVSPVLAFGFLGPKPQLSEVCAFFKVNRGAWLLQLPAWPCICRRVWAGCLPPSTGDLAPGGFHRKPQEGRSSGGQKGLSWGPPGVRVRGVALGSLENLSLLRGPWPSLMASHPPSPSCST